ncbi:hypothetical protein [Niveispirillum sp. BGYR6]|uniref:lipase family protein n=1 Tax=Niveispirillum sp. BGYR6 TaxID=2971249 RepID=UPI0022B9B433|nr:hypothetical protein [Niveispirillum sp. BGYR6]MDG5496272.1 hypothetical protein [Niveispirillum sp. BGYR6]
MSGTFDAFEQTFTLSLLSNLASGYIADKKYPGTGADPLENQLVANIALAFKNSAVSNGLGSGWEIKWGPAVYRDSTSLVAQNSATVFYNDSVTFDDGLSYPTYVVAIAATNFISEYDWVVEDFSVSSTVDWTKYNPTVTPFPAGPPLATLTPVISQGTAIGVSKIANLTPTNQANGTDSLLAFITGLNNSGNLLPNTRIIFAGHSLAGALSPTFAFYLEAQKLLSNFQKTLVYPTAGATPGNAAFSIAFSLALPPQSVIGGNPWQSWNMLIHNQYDIVPHAWNLTTLNQIPTLYGNSSSPGGTPVPGLINLAILAAVADSAASTTAYTRLINQTFTPSSYGTTPSTAEEFLGIAAKQHVPAYITTILGSGFPLEFDFPPVNGVTNFKTDLAAIEDIVKWLEKHFIHSIAA